MLRLAVACLFAALSPPTLAQYAGPAVKTCQAHAELELKRNTMAAPRIVLDADADLVIEKYTQKIGSQFVSSLLRGNGAIVIDGQPATEFTFLCLLADEKRALFFDWLPRSGAPVLAQCRRAGAAQSGGCLEGLLRLADQDLTTAAAARFQAALEADKKAGGKTADAFRAADTAWRAYRDAECKSRQSAAGSAADSAVAQRACVVELTRRRARDLHEVR